MDAATAIVGVVSEFGDQWVTAPQCAGGGVSLEDARGRWWASSAVGGRWCRGGAEERLVLRMERVSARQQAWFGVERRETRRGERARVVVRRAEQQEQQRERVLVGFIREAGRGLTCVLELSSSSLAGWSAGCGWACAVLLPAAAAAHHHHPPTRSLSSYREMMMHGGN